MTSPNQFSDSFKLLRENHMWNKLKNSLAKCCRKFRESESGTAAVEFVFVVFPFILILGVIMEQGTLMFTEYTLQAAVQDSARLIRTGQAQAGGYSPAIFKSKICGLAGILVNCNASVTVYVASDANFAALKVKVSNMLGVGPVTAGVTQVSASYVCGGPLQTTAVVATYDWDFVLPFMNFFSNMPGGTKRRLVGFSMFQNEPFPPTTSCQAGTGP
jgi:Flp pilus assembly protein TadG